MILPAKPPFHPRQFRTCAVVGNSGDLLKTEFGKEIDGHDAVIRDNEAPVNEVNFECLKRSLIIDGQMATFSVTVIHYFMDLI